MTFEVFSFNRITSFICMCVSSLATMKKRKADEAAIDAAEPSVVQSKLEIDTLISVGDLCTSSNTVLTPV